MKNLLIDEIIVKGEKQKIENMHPDKKKNMIRDFFLPKFGLSIIKNERSNDGASPRTVYI